jgi:hypothetical protein
LDEGDVRVLLRKDYVVISLSPDPFCVSEGYLPPILCSNQLVVVVAGDQILRSACRSSLDVLSLDIRVRCRLVSRKSDHDIRDVVRRGIEVRDAALQEVDNRSASPELSPTRYVVVGYCIGGEARAEELPVPLIDSAGVTNNRIRDGLAIEPTSQLR